MNLNQSSRIGAIVSQEQIDCFRRLIDQPIPAPPANFLENPLGWKQIPIAEAAPGCQKLEAVANFQNFRTSEAMAWPAYYKMPGEDKDQRGLGELTDVCSGRLARSPFVFARPEIIARLNRAQGLLDAGPETAHLQLVVVDGFRPLELQDRLFATYHEYLREKHPDWSKDQLLAEAQKMVSIAPKDPQVVEKSPPHHLTGAAVDVVLVEKAKINFNDDNWLRSAMIDFGADFDEMIHPVFADQRSAARYYETDSSNPEARANRRILYGAMTAAGFSNYDFEWFHFQYGNQAHAYLTGAAQAEFGSAAESYPALHNELAAAALPALEFLLYDRGMSVEDARREARADLGLD